MNIGAIGQNYQAEYRKIENAKNDKAKAKSNTSDKPAFSQKAVDLDPGDMAAGRAVRPVHDGFRTQNGVSGQGPGVSIAAGVNEFCVNRGHRFFCNRPAQRIARPLLERVFAHQLKPGAGAVFPDRDFRKSDGNGAVPERIITGLPYLVQIAPAYVHAS